MDTARIDGILARFEDPAGSLIAVLQETQEALGYLPEEALLHISRRAGIPAADIAGVASFYAQFRLKPPGKHHIMVCMGTACHVNGAKTVAEAVEEALCFPEGETTQDGLFSWEKVACLGCCSLAPVMMVDGRAYGKLSEGSVGAILDTFRRAETGGEA